MSYAVSVTVNRSAAYGLACCSQIVWNATILTPQQSHHSTKLFIIMPLFYRTFLFITPFLLVWLRTFSQTGAFATETHVCNC
jgi:hypothetical protein